MGKNFKKILLAADYQDRQFIFREAISAADGSISCSVANKDAQALKILNSGTVNISDVIFPDANTPVVNGLNCLKELKKSDKYNNVPVVMYLILCFAGNRQLCFNAKTQEYIVKRFNFPQLTNMLKVIMNNGLPINTSYGRL